MNLENHYTNGLEIEYEGLEFDCGIRGDLWLTAQRYISMTDDSVITYEGIWDETVTTKF